MPPTAPANPDRSSSRSGERLRIPEQPQKLFDDKFGVLAPPSALQPAIAYWRYQCDFRDVGLSLAYFDIDNFKNDFNSHTETIVDRYCLPVIMRAIEAHCFVHAEAYHFGGDEFVVLMPNTTKNDAIVFMDRLRLKLPAIIYVSIPAKAHISIGLVNISPDCALTNHEIVQKANDAKRHAKTKGGKNCIVTYKGDDYSEDQLVVSKPSITAR